VRKIQGKGTFVAPRDFARPFWGIIVPFYAEFYVKAITQLRHVTDSRGVVLEHACDYDSWERQLEIVKDFIWRRAQAIILVPTRDEAYTIGELQRAARRQPVVLFDRTSIASQLPYVIQDYAHGVRAMLNCLTTGGARRIAYVRDPIWPGSNPIYQTMEETYRQICEAMPEGYVRFWDSSQAFTAEDLGEPEFDGLMCVNDSVACVMTGLLREHGVDVPGRVQVAGYNYSDVGRFFTPRITTTNPDLGTMCERVAQMIDRARGGEGVANLQYVMIPTVVEGETTRKDEGRRMKDEEKEGEEGRKRSAERRTKKAK